MNYIDEFLNDNRDIKNSNDTLFENISQLKPLILIFKKDRVVTLNLDKIDTNRYKLKITTIQFVFEDIIIKLKQLHDYIKIILEHDYILIKKDKNI